MIRNAATPSPTDLAHATFPSIQPNVYLAPDAKLPQYPDRNHALHVASLPRTHTARFLFARS